MNLRTSILFALFCVTATLNCTTAIAQSPAIYSQDGEFLGNLNNNPYDYNSVANPYGKYGSPYGYNSVNNPYGKYGSQYSAQGANNPYGSYGSPVVVASDGRYLGRLNKNRYDSDSVANPYGRYGSPYSSSSIQNPYSTYGNPYSANSATNQYGMGVANPHYSRSQYGRNSFNTGFGRRPSF